MTHGEKKKRKQMVFFLFFNFICFNFQNVDLVNKQHEYKKNKNKRNLITS